MALLTSEHSTHKKTSEQDEKWERFERKFFVCPERVAFARSMMTHLCLPDGKYPHGKINSLYFDTPDLDHFQKSDDGNYERYKVRIRWYDNAACQDGDVPVYLELKAKRGFASRKNRRKFLVPAERLRKLQNGNTIINRNVIIQTLAEFGYFSDEAMMPVIMISYERLRFMEILTGTRMSLDWRINSSLTSHGYGYGQPGLTLDGAVIEIKGPTMEIPLSIRPIGSTGIDWTRFSKYASCLEAQMDKPGSAGLTSPSGRIEPF